MRATARVASGLHRFWKDQEQKPYHVGYGGIVIGCNLSRLAVEFGIDCYGDVSDGSHGPAFQNNFGINVVLLSALKGGFYFHPTDEDLSVRTPEKKKPLECEVSVHSNSEIAVEASRIRSIGSVRQGEIILCKTVWRERQLERDADWIGRRRERLRGVGSHPFRRKKRKGWGTRH